MTVQQIVDLAVSSELKNLAVGKDTEAVVGYLNLGLIELYKRFPLKLKEHVITLSELTELYTMPADFMWLVEAYGEVPVDSFEAVNKLPVNEEDNPFSVNTVSWDVLQVPINIEGEFISIIYAAAPEYMSPVALDAEVPIPPQMIEAMLHYIGYRAHSSVTSEINAEFNTHYKKFEDSCSRITTYGMLTGDDLDMSGRISDRGFV